tara:strand:- start:700 stop:1443 length:744 start_codon:yes stop_codon:yes gene_type:complete
MANKKAKNVDHFDPTELETVELLTPDTTDQDAFKDDTIADPEGAEARAPHNRGSLYPVYLMNDYRVNDKDELEPQPSAIERIMTQFDVKHDSSVPDNVSKAFSEDLEKVIAGTEARLNVDGPTTGIQMMRETTTTWAEFISCIHDYVNSSSAVAKADDMPEWLLEREQKMVDLGYKARLLRDACSTCFDRFGLPGVYNLNRDYVAQAVENRLTRLAAWNTKKHKVSTAAKSMAAEASGSTDLAVDNC